MENKNVKPFDESDLRINDIVVLNEEPVEEMTMEEVCKALGKTIKIIK